MKKQLSIFLFTLLAIPSLTWGTAVYKDDLLTLGTSAPYIALGQIKGFTQSAAVIFETPVGLSGVNNNAALFYTSTLANSVQFITAAASYKLTPELVVGFGYGNESIPNLDSTALNSDNQVVSNGSFQAGQSQLTLGGAWTFSQVLSMGASITHYQNQISTVNGGTLDLNLGVTYSFPWLMASGFINNLLANKLTYNNGGSESLNREIGISMASYPTSFYNSEVFGQLKMSNNQLLKSIGTRFSPIDSQDFKLSAALKETGRVDGTSRYSISLGAALKLQPVTLEYAFDTTEIFQEEFQHYFSVSVNF